MGGNIPLVVSPMTKRRNWLWLLAINAFANIVIEATFHDHAGETWWLGVLRGAWPGFVVSTTISSLCMFVLPRLAPILYHKLQPWVRWMIVVATLVLLAVVGSAIAVAVVTAVGDMSSWDAFFPSLWETVRVAILVTLVFGIYTTTNEALKSRLDRTTLALRTKERDEAEARRIASEAQLASLESRVNPHFFFNTLNSIAALTREDAARAERMTTQLASLMRSALNVDSTPLVPLEQEAQNVRDYLEIEHVRFGRRLRYDIRISDEALAVLVPRLAVQTVVENSVKYAVSVQPDGASLCVSAERANGRVRLEITDDGPGFDATALPDGHGLALIRARLALLYGENATLSVTSQPGHTTVAMDLPAAEAG